MKTLNKYTYLFIGIIAIGVLVLFMVIPRFEKQAFDPGENREYIRWSYSYYNFFGW